MCYMKHVATKFYMNLNFNGAGALQSQLKSHETVVRFEAAAGTKTVSNILLFLSLSSFSSFTPPVSTFSLVDIDTQHAHLKSYC